MPSQPDPDIAYQLAEALLGHVVQRLTDLGAAPGRAFVCGEDSIPADDCCKGLVWTRVAAVVPTNGGTDQYAPVTPNSAAPVPGHAIRLEVGALRCAPTVNQQGKPPKPELYTASALASARDRRAVILAVECDLPGDIDRLEADGQVPDVWSPIYNGECAGGFMTTQVITTSVL